MRTRSVGVFGEATHPARVVATWRSFRSIAGSCRGEYWCFSRSLWRSFSWTPSHSSPQLTNGNCLLLTRAGENVPAYHHWRMRMPCLVHTFIVVLFIGNDHIFSLRQLLDRRHSFSQLTVSVFLEHKATFDSVDHSECSVAMFSPNKCALQAHQPPRISTLIPVAVPRPAENFP